MCLMRNAALILPFIIPNTSALQFHFWRFTGQKFSKDVQRGTPNSPVLETSYERIARAFRMVEEFGPERKQDLVYVHIYSNNGRWDYESHRHDDSDNTRWQKPIDFEDIIIGMDFHPHGFNCGPSNIDVSINKFIQTLPPPAHSTIVKVPSGIAEKGSFGNLEGVRNEKSTMDSWTRHSSLSESFDYGFGASGLDGTPKQVPFDEHFDIYGSRQLPGVDMAESDQTWDISDLTSSFEVDALVPHTTRGEELQTPTTNVDGIVEKPIQKDRRNLRNLIGGAAARLLRCICCESGDDEAVPEMDQDEKTDAGMQSS